MMPAQLDASWDSCGGCDSSSPARRLEALLQEATAREPSYADSPPIHARMRDPP